MTAGKDLTGVRSHRLVALEALPPDGGRRKWKCLCDCGKETSVTTSAILNGSIQSCGCARKGVNQTHGKTGTPEYQAWQGMWKRCTNPASADYEDYKGRCPPEIWRDFEVFFKELGERPSPDHSLERIKNDLPYGPGNCKWDTDHNQCRNRKSNVYVTGYGKTMVRRDWEEELGLPRNYLQYHLRTKTLEQSVEHYRKEK